MIEGAIGGALSAVGWLLAIGAAWLILATAWFATHDHTHPAPATTTTTTTQIRPTGSEKP